jgi:hypothetical protein
MTISGLKRENVILNHINRVLSLIEFIGFDDNMIFNNYSITYFKGITRIELSLDFKSEKGDLGYVVTGSSSGGYDFSSTKYTYEIKSVHLSHRDTNEEISNKVDEFIEFLKEHFKSEIREKKLIKII